MRKKTKEFPEFEPTPAKPKKWHEKESTQWVFRASAALIVVGLVVWWFFFYPFVSTDDARVAATMIRIAPQGAGGRVITINVSEGSWLKKDDTAVELDHKTAEAQLLRARARNKYAQSELIRSQTLFRQGSIPSRDMEKTISEAGNAEADLRIAEIALENTYLKSPTNGIVVQKPAEVGNIIEPGQTAITVVDIENSWISANIEETAIKLVKPGQKVHIKVDEGGSLEGEVLEVRHAAASAFSLIPSDSASGNFIKLVQRIPIKVSLKPHAGKVLRVGQSVEIRIKVH